MSRAIRPALAGILASVARGYRAWRADQLMPSVLFNMNSHQLDDLGLIPQDVIDRRDPRGRT